MAYIDGNEILFSANVNARGELENKEITENGTYTASEGFDGLGEVVVNIPEIPTQEKTVEITENGTTEITADEDYALSKVTAIVSVGGGENKLAQLVGRTITEVTAADLEGVTEIGRYAFSYCEPLEKVTIPNNVASVSPSAFSNCKNLATFIFGEGTKYFNGSVFSSCSKLKSVYYGGDLASWCGIQYSTIGASPTSQGAQLYLKNASGEYEPLTDIIIPNTVTTIQPIAFYKVAGITNITIPSSVTFIGSNSFSSTDFTSITIDNGLKTIGTSAFSNCAYFMSLVIPDSVTDIGENAFQYCHRLADVVVGRGVVNIGRNAFYMSQYVPTNVTFTFLATTPPSIQQDTFLIPTDKMGKIIVPKGCGDAYKSATNWANYADYIEEAAE